MHCVSWVVVGGCRVVGFLGGVCLLRLCVGFIFAEQSRGAGGPPVSWGTVGGGGGGRRVCGGAAWGGGVVG